MYNFLLFIIALLANFNILGAENFFSVSYDDSNKIILNVNLPQNSSIAWKYAGQLGEKTEIKLNSLENLESYDIIWPFPKKATTAGKYLSYYYDSNFSLPIILKAKDQNKEIKFSLQISGVLCRNNQCEKISENINNLTIHPHRYIENKNKFESFEIKSLKLEGNTAIFTMQFTNNNLIDKRPDFIVEPTKKMFLGFGEVKDSGKIGTGEFLWKVPLLEGYKNYIGQDFTIYSNQNESRGMKFKFHDTNGSAYDYTLIYIFILPLLIGFGLSFVAEPGFLTSIIQNSYNSNNFRVLRILLLTFINFSLIGILEFCVTNIIYFITSIPTHITILIIIFAIFWSFYAISKDQDILPKYLVRNFTKLTIFLRSKLSYFLKNLQFKRLFMLIYVAQIFFANNGIFSTLIFSFFIALGFLFRYLYNIFSTRNNLK